MKSGRTCAILIALLGGIAVLVTTGTVWVETEVAGAPLTLTGADLAPAATALGIAALVIALAMLFAQARLARVLGVLAVLLGVAACWAVLDGALDPTSAVRVALEERTGLSAGAQELPALRQTPTAGIAVAGAVAVALGGIEALRTARSWSRQRGTASRYERTDSGLAWDAIDAGEDPTLEQPRRSPEDR